MDWRNPNYAEIFRQRLTILAEIRKRPECLPALKVYYRDNPADFINDWGLTFDPRNAERGLPSLVPFVLFPRQREWVDWVVGHWKNQTPGLTEKSRDMGISWLATALACTLSLFYDGLAIGFGSRLVDYVDKIGTMKPLLPKARMFMENLPEEFRGGWVSWRDAPYMRLNFPETGSIIMGEGGDQIGRGDRASIYIVDEAAYLERADLVERSLSQTTNCRIDVSSVNGPATVFQKKRRSGKIDVFVFDWREDPRKDDEWYRLLSADESQGGKGLDPVTIAQEVDRDESASVEGIVIPGPWVRAAIDAVDKLRIGRSGKRSMSLDVADEGIDKNAACARTGVEIDLAEEWSGKGGDLFSTTQRAFQICDENDLDGFRYDADGLGAGVRGDARIINESRQAQRVRVLRVSGFRGSDAVFDPDGIVDGTIGSSGDRGRTNKDYFANRKAQGWWRLRKRFQKTYRWVVEGIACSHDEIISISSKIPLYQKLVSELSQPTYSINGAGKILVNKKPDGMPSPNLADAAMIEFADNDAAQMEINQEMIAQIMRSGRQRRF